VSGLALVADLEGRPVDPGALRVLLEAQAHRGPDGSCVRSCGFAALAHLDHATTALPQPGAQPVVDDDLILALDGRLDEPDALARLLEVPTGEQLSDARLLLRAYRCWGVDGFARAIGSYAAIVVETRQRRVVLARDALGVRTLYYAVAGSRLWAASEDSALVALPGLGGVDELDEERVVRFLATEPGRPGGTFFSKVREVPAAHVVVYEADRAEPESRCYWRPGDTCRHDARGRSEREWTDLLRERLDAAVESAMRGPAVPAVMLSGGLDSGSVAALASKRLAAAGRPPLRAFSWTFDELPACDERAFVRGHVEKWNVQVEEIPGDALGPLSDLSSYLLTPARPGANAFRPLKQHLYRRAASAGDRVLLSGATGDSMYIGADRGWMRSAVREARYGLLAREGWRHIREARWWALRRGLTGLFLPHRAVRRRTAFERWPWLEPDARRLLDERLEVPHRVDRRWQALVGPRAAEGTAGEDELAAREGIEVRDPYRDRRLVELSLLLPDHLLFRGGVFKYVLRRAMSDDLPPAVRDRRSTSTLFPLFVRGMLEGRDSMRRLMEEERAWSRYVRPEWVERAWLDLPKGRLRPIETVALWSTIAFTLWFRRLSS
jgi:asparagine synthase (glutamine-hydrolysing)